MGTRDGWLERNVRDREPSWLLSDIAGVLEGHREFSTGPWSLFGAWVGGPWLLL